MPQRSTCSGRGRWAIGYAGSSPRWLRSPRRRRSTSPSGRRRATDSSTRRTCSRSSGRSATASTRAAPRQRVRFCGVVTRLAPNGLKGAGINFTNLDNVGKFPGLRSENADRRFAVCASRADALREFKNTVAADLRGHIAGEGALVIPENLGGRRRRARRAQGRRRRRASPAGPGDARVRGGAPARARAGVVAGFLPRPVGRAGAGSHKVTGLLTDVPRTRLAELSALNLRANRWTGGVLPRRPLREEPFDLRLSLFADVLRHPGGARVKRVNEGEHLAGLRRGDRAGRLHPRPDRSPALVPGDRWRRGRLPGRGADQGHRGCAVVAPSRGRAEEGPPSRAHLRRVESATPRS